MPAAYHLILTPDQTAELQELRDHAPLPYVRERAAVLLKMAHGLSILGVARHGGLKPHHEDTVRGWLRRYLAQGRTGLLIRKGRGRKPASFPAR